MWFSSPTPTPTPPRRGEGRQIGVLAGSITALLTTLLLLATPALADPPTGLEPAFGNTIVSTHPDGRQAKLWLNADHTFQAQGRGGNRSSGVWRLRGARLCLTQRRPVSIPFSYCHAFPRMQVGQSWRDTAVNGDAVTNRIVRGR